MELEKITELVIELEIDDIAKAVSDALNENVDPYDILNALTEGMDEVGRRYENNEYYLAELVLAGETMKSAFNIIKPAMSSADQTKTKERVIICTVQGDQHDIGKNLLGTLLMSSGFDVIDLGTDVAPNTIIEKVKETGAGIVGLSSLLTMTLRSITDVDNALKQAGLRDKVKLIVGGAPLNDELSKKLGADDYAPDAVSGVKRIKSLLN